MQNDVRRTLSASPSTEADFSYQPTDAAGRTRMFLRTPTTSADYLDRRQACTIRRARPSVSRRVERDRWHCQGPDCLLNDCSAAPPTTSRASSSPIAKPCLAIGNTAGRERPFPRRRRCATDSGRQGQSDAARRRR